MATRKPDKADTVKALADTIKATGDCADVLLAACVKLQGSAAPSRHARVLQSVEPKVRAAAEALAGSEDELVDALRAAVDRGTEPDDDT